MSEDNLTRLSARMSVQSTHDLIRLMERHCRLTQPLVLDEPIDEHFETMIAHMMAPLVQLVIAHDRERILGDFREYGEVAAFFAEATLFVLHNLRDQEKA